ncbi:MAG: hypothetical protein QOJ03_2344 [Frankiaceae bacterium]|nr:hypothetical protein [Frankiaceae bacterium]
MERIVIADRTMGRVLAVLPAIAVAVAVRLLTLADPPLWVRVVAAGVVAVSCWIAYRLLTSQVVVGDHGVEVRGVLYDAEIPWAHLESIDVKPSGVPLRALVWGVMQPHTMRLRTGSRTLRPVAAISHADDEELSRAIGAMRVRVGAWRVPAQRQSQETVSSV